VHGTDARKRRNDERRKEAAESWQQARKQTIIEEFWPDRVRPLPGQPRKRFAGIRELADSISEIGQSCPGIVTLVKDDPAADAQLVDGERRLRACKLIGVPFRAEVRDAASLEDLFVASFGANFGKQEHDAIEVAEGLARMQAAGKTMEQMAKIAGKSISWVANHLNLLKLHPSVQRMMIRGGNEYQGREADEEQKPHLTFQLAQLLVAVDEAKQIQLARKITDGEGMSLSGARRMILQVRHKSGDKAAYSGGRRGLSLGGIERAVTQFADRLGVYLDMPGMELNRLIDCLGTREKRELIDQLGDMTESLTILAESIEKRMPKVGSSGRSNA
jgi:ParB/RepB/Spo0J family partition protein